MKYSQKTPSRNNKRHIGTMSRRVAKTLRNSMVRRGLDPNRSVRQQGAKMTPLELLEQAAIEGRSSTGFYQSDDRILWMIDEARRTLSPASNRTPEMHQAAMEAGAIAIREIAKTITGQEIDCDVAYQVVTEAGERVNYPEFSRIMATTIARLKQSVALAVAAE